LKNNSTNKSDSNSHDREINSNNKSSISGIKEPNDNSQEKEKSNKKKENHKKNSEKKKNKDWESLVLLRKDSVNGKIIMTLL